MTGTLAAYTADARRVERERGALRAFLLLAVIPNLALRAAEFAARGTATIVNIEFLAIALAAPFLGVQLTVAALVVAIAADVTTFIAPVFHFEMDAVIPSLAELASARPLLFAILAVVIVALLWLASRTLMRGVSMAALRDGRMRAALLGAIVILVAADAANGSGNAISTRRTFLPVNIAGAPSLQLALATIRPLREARLPNRPVVPVASATSGLFADLDGGAAGIRATNVAVVLVESMGQLLDRGADSALFSALLDTSISARYDVRRGTVHFEGPTTGGEFRELCGELRTYRTAPATPLASCLPARLHRLGYTTIALHGFRRGMFDRKRWYPLIGIDSIIDDATIISTTPGDVPKCGSIFRGPCDAAVAPIFTRLLTTAGQHRLVYWLTLSAHFPADARAAEGSTFDCAVSSQLAGDGSACMLARIWSRDLAAVRAAALADSLPPTRFIIVGDHAPPLPGDRLARLFATDVVPFVELIPRGPRSELSHVTSATHGAR